MIHIVSQNYQIFKDRHEAGMLLAKALGFVKKSGTDAVVLGIPRGGIIVAEAIAQALQLPLDIVLTSKLGAPYQPELAIGAIDENGHYFINKTLRSLLQIDNSYLSAEREHKLYQLTQKKARYRAVKQKVPLTDKIAIVVDDGIATGASLQTALTLVKQENPHTVIAAIPVGPLDAIRQMESYADEIVCWQAPPTFGAVGEYYENFTQTTDDEVLAILKKYKT